jgi:hypothetical protein
MSDLLSSDILERQFGPTELTVLYQGGTSRIICTKAKASGQVLELSFVNFTRAGAEKFPEVHRAVLAGTSMGKAFRASSVAFRRKERIVHSNDLATHFGRQFGGEGPATILEVTILAGPDKTPYAEILETYSPAVRWPRRQGGKLG